jgi:drug/metabolite transporter (DMT)-like permease
MVRFHSAAPFSLRKYYRQIRPDPSWISDSESHMSYQRVMSLFPSYPNLPPNTQGAIWLFGSAVIFSAMNVAIKIVGTAIPSVEIAFFRCLFGLISLLPFLPYMGRGVFSTERFGLHVLRAALGLFAMSANFYAVTKMELAPAVAITFTSPLFMIVLAVIYLDERPGLSRILATCAGFIGTIIMLEPGSGEPTLPAIAALVGALAVAFVLVVVKKLATTERPMTALIYFSIFSTLASAPPALYFWVSPSANEFIVLAAIGVLGSMGQYCLIKGYRLGEATVVTPISYVQLVLVGLVGFFAFGERPSLMAWLGTMIIVISTLYITLEGRKKSSGAE